MRRSVAALVLVTLIAPAHASPDQAAQRWASDVRRVEELVAASIETGDAGEMRRQVSAAHSLVGRASSDLQPGARFSCVSAASALANTASDLLGTTPAKALINARADGKIYREHMTDCDRKLGTTGKSHLPF